MAVIYGSNVNVKSTNKGFATITDGTNDGSENYLCMQRYVISDPHTGSFFYRFPWRGLHDIVHGINVQHVTGRAEYRLRMREPNDWHK